MRSFEQAVCRQFRQIDTQFVQFLSQIHIPNMSERVRALESSIKELENTTELDTFQAKEQMIEAEQEIGRANLRMEYYEKLTKVRFGKVIEKMKEKVKKITENLDTLQSRVQILEFEMDGEIQRTEWIDDGHSVEHDQLPPHSANGKEPNGGEGRNEMHVDDCEIMIMDPFLGGITPLEGYDGNPGISFSRWVARFEDMLALSQYTETQKLSRLRILLKGQARAEFEAMEPPADTLAAALNHLKRKFENENTRSIARQAMASCKQAPGERVYEFANRLSDAVRTALAGESEEIIRKRMFEEFLEKLTPELQFEVKAGRPTSYSNAYEIAQHFELLLATKRHNQVSIADSVAELSHKVEALAVHRQPMPNRGVGDKHSCFYCKRNYGDERFNNRNYGDEQRWNRDRNPRDNRYFSNRGRGQREERTRRTPTPYGRENEQNYGAERRPSPGRRVNFGGGRIGAARIASPLFLALIVVLSLFGQNSATNPMASPMICPPDSPSSLWSIPADPICPTWSPTEIPVPMRLSVFRLNTIQYKTMATACKCVLTKISRRIGFFGGRYEEVTTSPLEVPTAMCLKMKESCESPAGKLVQTNGIFKATENSLEVGWRNWPAAMFWQTKEVSNCYTYETVVFTRHGMAGLNTPVNDCPACSYQSGSCRCPQLS
ncbi:hypothetical protein niasHT_031872 [Heterodera trifolii]|uniref:Paraneoplastic antigen Ma-like C-terminal domain-containing protein n=1 Tax=Heterodera trifolii TaxID=157864 RepID=A0ABD2IEB0_9BILA